MVSEVFRRALERAPEERDLFLAEACGGDTELRAEVDALLAEHGEAGSFLAEPLLAPERSHVLWDPVAEAADSQALTDASGAAAARPLVGAVLEGKYAIEARLGAGGMGESTAPATNDWAGSLPSSCWRRRSPATAKWSDASGWRRGLPPPSTTQTS
jgi:hypothetical protein